MNKHMIYFISLMLRFLSPFLFKYYSIKIASSREEKEKVFKFRYQAYRVELNHYFLDDKCIVNECLFDEEDFSENTLIFYAGNIDNIIGTIRISVWDKNNLPKKIQEKYFLDDKTVAHFKKIGEIRYFQIKKEYRRSLLGLTLMPYFSKIGYENNKFLADILFCNCQPGLLGHYMSVGCFAYTDRVIYKEFDFLQIPLAVIPYDYAYMRKAHSFTYHLSKYYNKIYSKTLSPDQRPISKNNILPVLTLRLTQSQIDFYRSQFTKKSFLDNFNFIIENIKNVFLFSIESGTVIIKKDLQDYDCYLLLEGKLGVYFENALLAELQPGEIFGEMALLSKYHKRYVSVLAMSDVKVLMISRNVLYVLEKKSPKIAIQFLHLLCKSIIRKIHFSNAILYEQFKSKN